MERESLVTLLIMILGGLAMQLLAAWPAIERGDATSPVLERNAWRALCRPVAPFVVICAWLIGWALVEPDPVTDRLNPLVIVSVWLPFGLLFARAGARAAWALLREPPECAVSTVGFLQPQVVFSPYLARRLEEPVVRAAMAHERAHARHRDPLRIWLAQLITDLQWPWPQAQQRLDAWLAALELARDEEARREGVEGTDLAAAVLASVRFLGERSVGERLALGGTQFVHARLIGNEHTLQYRVSRLLSPLRPDADASPRTRLRMPRWAAVLIPLLLAAMLLGVAYGDWIMRPLLGLTS